MMTMCKKYANVPYLAGIVVLLFVSFARGGTIRRVDVDSTCTTGCDGSTWFMAYKSLSRALGTANSGDEIWVAEGTYKPTRVPVRAASFTIGADVQVYGGFVGNEFVRSARDIEAHETILSGDIPAGNPPADPSESYHVVSFAADVDRNTILDGFTIQDGHWGDVDSAAKKGAGIYNPDGSPIIRNCRIQNCDGLFGGGLYSGDGEPIVENCIFVDNTAGHGGGLHLINSGTTAKVVHCTFASNDAIDVSAESVTGHGGGMYLSTSSPEVRNSIFWNNTSANETDETAQVYYAGGTVDIEYCCIKDCGTGTDDYCDSGQTYNNIDDDPVFTSSPTDLTLGSTTPCDDVGNNHFSLHLSLDRGGDARIQNCDVDMGAYERTSAATCIFYVDATQSAADGEGSSWSEAFQYLQDALVVGTSGDLIWVADGNYYPDEGVLATDDDRVATFQLPNGIVILGGFAGSETDGVECSGNGEFCESDEDCPGAQTCDDNRSGNASILSGDLDGNDTQAITTEAECEENYPAAWTNSTCFRSRVFIVLNNKFICEANGFIWAEADSECRIPSTFTQTKNLTNSYHVVSVDETAADVIIDGFTITAGNADASGPPDHQGPGLSNRDRADAAVINNDLTVRNCVFDGNFSNNHGALNDHGLDTTVDDCTFTDNYTEVRGAGMYIHQGGNASITECTFIGNYSHSIGGGLYVNSSSSTVSNPTVEGCTFSYNFSYSGGGALYVAQGSTATIKASSASRSVFDNNQAPLGGAIYSDDASPTIKDSDFFANGTDIYPLSSGAAIYGQHGDTLTISGCNFVENSATNFSTVWFDQADGTLVDCRFVRDDGGTYGAVSIGSGTGSPTVGVSNCVFVGGKSTGYGSLFMGFAAVSIDNCLFVGNASSRGAVVCMNGQADITNCTIALNDAGEAEGGIHIGPQLDQANTNVVNTIVWNNTVGASGAQILNESPSDTSISYCDIECAHKCDSNGDPTDPLCTGTYWCTDLGSDDGGNTDDDPDFEVVTASGGSWVTANDSAIFDEVTYQTTFTDADGSFGATDALKDFVFRGNTDNVNYTYIVGSTGTTITVWGDVRVDFVDGKTYELLDFHVQSTSPVIDTGDNTVATDGTNPGDLLGNDRIVDGDDDGTCNEDVDMGAYEAPDDGDCP